MEIKLDWHLIVSDRDESWRWNLALYGLMHPQASLFFYVGKADGCTVWERCGPTAKADVWRYLESIGVDQVRVLVGEFLPSPGVRLTRQVVEDVESLLIQSLQPVANIQCRESRISRPGLRVSCHGDWPLQPSMFVDQ
jgi:hypothetical protein